MITISQYPRPISLTGNEILLAMTTDLAGASLEIRIDDHLGERLSTVTVAPDSTGHAAIDISTILDAFVEPIGYNAFGQQVPIRLCGAALQYSVKVIEKKDAVPGSEYFEWANGPVVKALRGAVSMQEILRNNNADPYRLLFNNMLNAGGYFNTPALDGVNTRIYFIAGVNASINLSVYKYSASGDRYGTSYITGGQNVKIYEGCIYEVTVPYLLVAGFDYWYLCVDKIGAGRLYSSNVYTIVPKNRYSEQLLLRNRFGAWDQVPMMIKTEDTDTETSPARIGMRAEAETSVSETISLVSKYYTSAETLCELATASEMYLLRGGCAVPFTPKSLALPLTNAGKRMNAVLQGSIDTSYRIPLKALPPDSEGLGAYIVDCDGNVGEGFAYGRASGGDILPNKIKHITATIKGGYIEFSPNNVLSLNNSILGIFTDKIGFDMARPYRFPLHFFTAEWYRVTIPYYSVYMTAGNNELHPFPILFYDKYDFFPTSVSNYMDTFGNNPYEGDFQPWARWSSFADNKLVDINGNASLDVQNTPIIHLADSLSNSITVPCNFSINPLNSFTIEMALQGDWNEMSLFYLHGTNYDLELRSDYGYFVFSIKQKNGDILNTSIMDGGASVSWYWKHLHMSYNQNTGIVHMTIIGTDVSWNQTYSINFPAMMLPAGLETFSKISFNSDVNTTRNRYLNISFFRVKSLSTHKAVVVFSGRQAYEVMSKSYAEIDGTDDGGNWRSVCHHIWGQVGYEIWDNGVNTLLVPLANDGESMSEGRNIPATNGRSLVNTIMPNSDVIDIRSGFEFRTKSEELKARDTSFIFFKPDGMQREITASYLRDAFLQNVPYLRADTTQYTVSRMRMS